MGYKLGIIGCGNMGGAIARGILEKGLLPKDCILLCDKDIEKVSSLAEDTGCIKEEIFTVCKEADYLLVAVKPQNFGDLAGEISSNTDKPVILSVMAGITIDSIGNALGKDIPVARAMPNMAAFIGKSITGVTCNKLIKSKDEIFNIFSAVGKVVEVEEAQMDAVTALSGSGPAYLFYLADAMITAGLEMGFNEEKSRQLVVQTLLGAAGVLANSNISPRELIRKVASKGGTTEAALNVFNEDGVKGSIEKAIHMAKQRSVELSGGN